MKGIRELMVTGLFVLATTSSFAATKTAIDAHWICTTNASSSTLDADKAADTKMAKSSSSAADAYAFAVSNCRDCTKITCEAQSQ
jgi:hypothetical protein